MACCGPEQKRYDEEDLQKKLRNIGNSKICMKLKSDVKDAKTNKNIKCVFDKKQLEWDANIDKVYGSVNSINEKEDEQIRDLKQKIMETELEIEKLEKEYLAKSIRLLYMAQAHCEIKTVNEELFEDFGIKTGNAFLPGTEGLRKFSDDNSESEKESKKKNKNKKVLENA